MMEFSSSPSQSLILNSGEAIVHVKIVIFFSENSLLKVSRIFICTNLKSFYDGNLSFIKSFDFLNFRASLSTATTQRFLYKLNASFLFD